LQQGLAIYPNESIKVLTYYTSKFNSTVDTSWTKVRGCGRAKLKSMVLQTWEKGSVYKPIKSTETGEVTASYILSEWNV